MPLDTVTLGQETECDINIARVWVTEGFPEVIQRYPFIIENPPVFLLYQRFEKKSGYRELDSQEDDNFVDHLIANLIGQGDFDTLRLLGWGYPGAPFSWLPDLAIRRPSSGERVSDYLNVGGILLDIWRWTAGADKIRSWFNASKGKIADRRLDVQDLEKLEETLHAMLNPRLIGDPSNPERIEQRMLAFMLDRLLYVKRHPISGRAMSLDEQLREIRDQAAYGGLGAVDFIAEELLAAMLMDVLQIPVEYLDCENWAPGFISLANPRTLNGRAWKDNVYGIPAITEGARRQIDRVVLRSMAYAPWRAYEHADPARRESDPFVRYDAWANNPFRLRPVRPGIFWYEAVVKKIMATYWFLYYVQTDRELLDRLYTQDALKHQEVVNQFNLHNHWKFRSDYAPAPRQYWWLYPYVGPVPVESEDEAAVRQKELILNPAQDNHRLYYLGRADTVRVRKLDFLARMTRLSDRDVVSAQTDGMFLHLVEPDRTLRLVEQYRKAFGNQLARWFSMAVWGTLDWDVVGKAAELLDALGRDSAEIIKYAVMNTLIHKSREVVLIRLLARILRGELRDPKDPGKSAEQWADEIIWDAQIKGEIDEGIGVHRELLILARYIADRWHHDGNVAYTFKFEVIHERGLLPRALGRGHYFFLPDQRIHVFPYELGASWQEIPRLVAGVVRNERVPTVNLTQVSDSWLRDERGCPFCYRQLLRGAGWCDNCGRDVPPEWRP